MTLSLIDTLKDENTFTPGPVPEWIELPTTWLGVPAVDNWLKSNAAFLVSYYPQLATSTPYKLTHPLLFILPS